MIFNHLADENKDGLFREIFGDCQDNSVCFLPQFASLSAQITFDVLKLMTINDKNITIYL